MQYSDSYSDSGYSDNRLLQSQFFTCGAHDAGLGTIGSLLNLLLKPTSFFKAHVSPKDLKLGMEPKMVMRNPKIPNLKSKLTLKAI